MTAMEIPPAALKAASAKLSQRWPDDWHSTDVWINAHPDAVSEMVLEAALPHLLSEVKVLTETATRVAYALGRKDALTEIADEMAVEQEYLSYVTFQTDRDTALLLMAAKTSSQATEAASDATSGVPESSEVGSEPQAVSNRLLDLNRLIGVKWGDKVIDPQEVIFVLRNEHQEVSEAARSPQEPCGHPTCPCGAYALHELS